MRRFCLVVLVAALASPAHAQWSSPPSGWDTTAPSRPGAAGAKFSVAYVPPKAQQNKLWFDGAKLLQMEKIADLLNQQFKMPNEVPIVFVECGTVNAFYTGEKHAILMCYELMQYFHDLFKPTVKTDFDLGKKIAGAVYFTFFHELGHAFANELDLPITGKEEDAADQLATSLLATFKEGQDAALAAAQWFAMEGEKKQKKGAIVWYDEHSFDLQRMYDIVCMLYGADQQPAYRSLVASVGMSEDRQARCVRETPKKMKAWNELLKPHRR